MRACWDLFHRLSQEKGEDVWRETGSYFSLSLFLSSIEKNCHLLKKDNYEEKEREVGVGGRLPCLHKAVN